MEIKNSKNVTIIKDEKQDDYSNDDLFNIVSWGADFSFRELISMYDSPEQELEKPELQRKYVWDKPEASRFIDSILLGLPVPSIFLANTKDHKKLIIDGYQRILTVYDYVQRQIFSKDGKIFKLTNTKRINKRWRGKSFKELTDAEQRKIKSSTIHAIVFEQKEPKEKDTSLYQIFERINAGGRVLKPQEIRNCVYQGLFNTLLIKLNKNLKWRQLFGLEQEDPRMLDLEFILRFFALGSEGIKNSEATQISLKKYLNEYMGSEDSNNETIINIREMEFTNTINFIYDKIGKQAFHNISQKEPFKLINKFNPTIFDSISIATNYALKKNIKLNTIDLEVKRKDLLMNNEYKNFITHRTTNIAHINGRIKLALQYLYGMNYE